VVLSNSADMRQLRGLLGDEGSDMSSQPGCSSVGDSMPSLEQTKHQVGITGHPVGFCVIMNPPSSDERHVAPLHTKSPKSNFAAGSSPRAKSGIARALMGAASVLTR